MYVGFLRKLGNWLLTHSVSRKSCFPVLLSCWRNPFPIYLFLKTPVREKELLRLNPLYFRLSCEKESSGIGCSRISLLESWTFKLSHLVAEAILRFIFYLNFPLRLNCIGVTRCVSCFSRKRKVGIGCSRILVSRKSCLTALSSRCQNPFPVNLLFEKFLLGFWNYIGFTRYIFYHSIMNHIRSLGRIKFLSQRIWCLPIMCTN